MDLHPTVRELDHDRQLQHLGSDWIGHCFDSELSDSISLQGIASICHSYTPVYLYKKFFLHYIHGSWIGIVT